MIKNKQFMPIIHPEWKELISALPWKSQAEVFMAILEYPNGSSNVPVIWNFIKKQIDDDKASYKAFHEQKCSVLSSNRQKRWEKSKSIQAKEEKPVITTPETKEEPKQKEESHNTNTDDHLGRRPIERIAEGTPALPYAGKVPKEVRDFAHSLFPHAVESSEAEKQRKTQEAIRQEMHEAIMNDDVPF